MKNPSNDILRRDSSSKTPLRMTRLSQNMEEFVFGSLSTVEKRTAQMRQHSRGVRHHNWIEPRTPSAEERPLITVTIEMERQIERVVCVVDAPADDTYALELVETNWDVLNWTYFQTWQVALPSQPDSTLVRYQIMAYPSDGSAPIVADDGATYSYIVGSFPQPAWARDAIVYQIFPDRFYAGNGRFPINTPNLNAIHGGTLQGVIDKLDYIADLGFNCIWLNPFFPDDTHHGYHATDYFNVNPRLGTLDTVRELVAKAHARGIRLLLDFVANHWGSRHPTFQAAQQDRHNDYYNWYHWIKWPHEYETFFGVQDLPKLNVDYAPVREHLLKVVRFWLGEIGFDGLRMDHAQGATHDFWTAVRAAAQSVKPDVWLFGEVVDTPQVQLSYDGQFNGCLDFLLTEALRKTFAYGNMSLTAFDNFLNQHEQFFPASYSHPGFLDNHDQDRFLFIAQNDIRKLKLAALCLFTLGGAPIIYNGTELGVSQNKRIADREGYGMAECRQPMPWQNGQPQELHAYFKWLIQLRKAHSVLRHGSRLTIHVDDETQTYVYARMGEETAVTILVALNLSNQPQTIKLKAPNKSRTHTFTLEPVCGDVTIFPKAR